MVHRPAVYLVLALCTASAARAERIDPEFRPDGSVRVEDQLFPTREAFYRSPVFQASGARCGTPDPDPLTLALLAPSDCSGDGTVINPTYNDNRTLIIQVVFHVVKNAAGSGNLTPALIQSQMDILNEDFEALANTPGKLGTNTKVHFVLAKLDPTGKATNGINVVVNNTYFTEGPGGGASPMKTALHWDTSKYLNIYTNQLPNGLLGYATFPFESAGSPTDGVVLLWTSVGRSAPGGPPYDQGRTLTHEVGHYLGLYHTFQLDQQNVCPAAASYTVGDLIVDTNAHRQPSFGCTAATDCGGRVTPIENYMNYTDDTCMTKYTPEQANRIRCSIINYRNVNTAPTAAFTFTAAEGLVTFTNASTDAETPAGLKYTWSFGDGMTSTDASPTHTYTTDGSYSVKLDVLDPTSGTATSTQMVTVAITPPAPAPDAGNGGGGGGGGGGDDDGSGTDSAGCCQAPGGDLSFALCAVPVVLVVLRRRRRR